jgi:hypothetical protein
MARQRIRIILPQNTATMDKEEMMDQMIAYLEEAQVHAKQLSAVMNAAKATPEGVTVQVLAEMARHQQAWAAAIGKHNEIAALLNAG